MLEEPNGVEEYHNVLARDVGVVHRYRQHMVENNTSTF